MMQISLSELKADAEKYIAMAQTEDIFITKNGVLAAKLVTIKTNNDQESFFTNKKAMDIFDEIRKQAADTPEMSLEEINEEIKAVRNERRSD